MYLGYKTDIITVKEIKWWNTEEIVFVSVYFHALFINKIDFKLKCTKNVSYYATHLRFPTDANVVKALAMIICGQFKVSYFHMYIVVDWPSWLFFKCFHIGCYVKLAYHFVKWDVRKHKTIKG